MKNSKESLAGKFSIELPSVIIMRYKYLIAMGFNGSLSCTAEKPCQGDRFILGTCQLIYSFSKTSGKRIYILLWNVPSRKTAGCISAKILSPWILKSHGCFRFGIHQVQPVAPNNTTILWGKTSWPDPILLLQFGVLPNHELKTHKEKDTLFLCRNVKSASFVAIWSDSASIFAFLAKFQDIVLHAPRKSAPSSTWCLKNGCSPDSTRLSPNHSCRQMH